MKKMLAYPESISAVASLTLLSGPAIDKYTLSVLLGMPIEYLMKKSRDRGK